MNRLSCGSANLFLKVGILMMNHRHCVRLYIWKNLEVSESMVTHWTCWGDLSTAEAPPPPLRPNSPADSDLMDSQCGLNTRNFKNSPGDSNM